MGRSGDGSVEYDDHTGTNRHDQEIDDGDNLDAELIEEEICEDDG